MAAAKVSTRKAPNLKSKTARLALQPGRSGFVVLGDGLALAYFRPKSPQAPGQWLARRRQPDGTYPIVKIGTADDFDTPDGAAVLDYKRAVALVIGGEHKPASAVTVEATCAAYVEWLRPRGGRAAGDAKAAFALHLQDLAKVRTRDLTEAQAAKAAARMPTTPRTNLKAALNRLPTADRPAPHVLRAFNVAATVRAVGLDEEGRALGLDQVPDQQRVAEIVAAARKHDTAFGRFVATLAVTGCRPIQVSRIRVTDLQGDTLLVPPSAKGKPGKPKPWARRPLPPALAAELRASAAGRRKDALLFPRVLHVRDATAGGSGWRVEGEAPWDRISWARAATAAGIEEGLYALRHAAVVRMLIHNVPIRVVASALDTSTAVLESVYSRWIGTHSEDLLRAEVEAADLVA
jgi:integrase